MRLVSSMAMFGSGYERRVWLRHRLISGVISN